MERLFGILLLILIAAAAGYFFFIRWAHVRLGQAARGLSGDLRRFETDYRELLARLQGYSAQDPPPYGALASRLQTIAGQIGQEFYGLRERYVQIQQLLPHKTGTPWQSLGVSPGALLKLQREITWVTAQLAQQQAALGEARELTQELEHLGWTTAQLARQVSAANVQLTRRLEALRNSHVHGSASDSLEEQAVQIQDALHTIPPHFLELSEEELFTRTDKAEVVLAFGSASQAQALQDQLGAELHGWEGQLTNLDNRLARLRQELSALEQTLAALPAAVDASTLLAASGRLQSDAGRLSAQASRPELEKLAEIEAAAGLKIQAARELAATAQQARQSQAALEDVLYALAQGQKQISDGYSTLGTARSYRILWSRTSSALARLSQQVGELGNADRKRTPEVLETDLAKANELAQSANELALYLQGTTSQHAELVALLESPEIAEALLWAQNSPKLLQQVGQYHPDNWPRADGVKDLAGDLHSLDQDLQRLGASRPGDGIAEDQLAQRLADARRLVGHYQGLRARTGMVEARLEDLQHSETQAQETLQATRQSLTQIGFIVNSNPSLVKIVGGEIERFQKQIDKQLAELGQRQQGAVDSKARQAAGLTLRIEQGLLDWLGQLDQENQGNVKNLTASLTRLDSIASLEDPPLAEARRLLASPQAFGGSPARKTGQVALESRVLEFKQHSEYAQACGAAVAALHDLEKPVVETYTSASQERQQVQDQFSAAKNWLRQARAWPPVEVDVETEYQALGNLEAGWAALKEKPLKALDLVQRLGDLARQYQALASRMSKLVEQGDREQREIQRLERELDDNLGLWEKLLAAYQDNPAASEDIQQLLSTADQEVYRIKTQFLAGELTYSQVVQSMQAAHRKVRLYQAVLDDSHTIDVNGRVIASRESQRAPGEW